MFDEEEYKDDLPNSEEMWDRIIQVDEADNKKLVELKKYLAENSKKFCQIFDKYTSKIEQTESSDVARIRHERFQDILGGLKGLATALIPKIEVAEYERLRGVTDDKKKTAATVMKEYAKGQSASTEGILEALNTREKVLISKILSHRTNVKKIF